MSAQVTSINKTRTTQRELTPAEFEVYRRITESGDLDDFNENLSVIAHFPQPILDEVFKALKGSIPRPFFDKLVNGRRAADTRAEWCDGRPVIVVNSVSLDESGRKAAEALKNVGNIYQRMGALVRITNYDAGPSIETLIPATMQPILGRAALFVLQSKNGGETLTEPPRGVVNYVLNSGDSNFIEIRGISILPIIHGDGESVITVPGYDPKSKMIYIPPPNFKLGDIPASPTQADARAAAQFLAQEIISQFPFAAPADKANCIGAMLTAVMRPGFDDLVPLFYFGARQSGSGKTLLAGVIAAIATGQPVAAISLPDNEAERSKTITMILDRGSAVATFDNTKGRLASQALEALATARVWESRRLGSNDGAALIRVANDTVWLLTANNAELGTEMARRTCPIMLDAKTARPETRTGFKRPGSKLIKWVVENRGEIVARLITMICAWHHAGKPLAPVPMFGSFDRWAETVGGVLQFAGVENFLGNLDTLHEESDVEAQQWESFFYWWARKFGDEPQLLSTVASVLCNPNSIDFIPDEIGAPPTLLEVIPGDTERTRPLVGFAGKLGRALRRKLGARFGDRGLHILKGADAKHAKVATWRLAGDLAGLKGELMGK